LNFPIGANPGLARAVGTMLKQDFQRTMVGRTPEIESHPEKYWRSVLFPCDEYHSFGGSQDKIIRTQRGGKREPTAAMRSPVGVSVTRSAETCALERLTKDGLVGGEKVAHGEL
jgi:hypothetical protein